MRRSGSSDEGECSSTNTDHLPTRVDACIRSCTHPFGSILCPNIRHCKTTHIMAVNRPILWNVTAMEEKIKDRFSFSLSIFLIGSTVLCHSAFLWNASVSKDKSDIAEGLYLDIASIEDYLVATDQQFLANPDDQYIFVQGTPLYRTTVLYSMHTKGIFPSSIEKTGRDTYTSIITLSPERDRNLNLRIELIMETCGSTHLSRARGAATNPKCIQPREVNFREPFSPP